MLQLVVELEAIERVVGRIEQANNDTLYQPSTGAILTFIHTTLHSCIQFEDILHALMNKTTILRYTT